MFLETFIKSGEIGLDGMGIQLGIVFKLGPGAQESLECPFQVGFRYTHKWMVYLDGLPGWPTWMVYLDGLTL